jgi:CHAD domain-containing protein
VPDAGPGSAASLDLVVDDQALAVLASIDDLRHDLAGSVHDARVAVRKMRSTLVVFGPMFDPVRCAELVEDLRWFAGELSGARDSQVIRSRITTAIHGNDADGDTSQALLAALDATTRQEWERAQAALGDPRTQQLVARLEQARLRTITGNLNGQPLVSRVGAAVSSLVRRAEKVLGSRADDERIHLLRKRVKRVRFALSAVRDSAYDALDAGVGAGRLARALEALQDLLGEYQDAVVTAQVLDRLGATVPAVAVLAGELAGAQRSAAARVRAAMPEGIERVRRAGDRMRTRTSGVHLGSE